MFYISRKKGRKFGVVDTSDNTEEFYFARELEEFYNRGIRINGVGYYKNKFSITPQVVVKDKVSASKNKLIKGSTTGIKGFDLDFRLNGDIVALPLTLEFFDYAKKLARNKIFIFNIPEGVTHLADNFFKSSMDVDYSYNINFMVVLPSTLKVIGSQSLFSWKILNIDFSNCNLSLIKSGGGRYNINSVILRGSNVRLDVDILECFSTTVANDVNYLSLPCIKNISSHCFDIGFRQTCLSLFLGDDLKVLPNIVEPYGYFDSQEKNFYKDLVSTSIIIYISDNSILDSIFIQEKSEGDFYSYIFVVSENYYNQKFKRIFKKSKDSNTYSGVLLYRNKDEYDWYVKNLGYCCKHVSRNFSKIFDNTTKGSYSLLQLKKSVFRY